MPEKIKTEIPAAAEAQTLTISPEKVCFVIFRANEYDVKDEPSMISTLQYLKSTKMIPSSRNLRCSSIRSPRTRRSIL
jgi:hypothetical protein